ncbi:unnamed protein product [Brassica rapa]|uniref:Uncharacterized protein n=1 Tax=Brassica campestris TaxID=3711 RepID=A0A3P6D4Z9_BRACM|nr:unnamed protein product [Brassica rapa]VDD15622.1 unnamed protein product [Brassica rapa]
MNHVKQKSSNLATYCVPVSGTDDKIKLPAEEEDLVEWARPYLTSKRKVVRIVDPRLDTQYLPEEAVRMASIADWRCSVSRSNQSHVRPWTKWSVPCNIFRTTWEYRLRPIRHHNRTRELAGSPRNKIRVYRAIDTTHSHQNRTAGSPRNVGGSTAGK